MKKVFLISLVAALVAFVLSAWSSYSDSCEDVDNPQNERFGLQPKITWKYPLMFAACAFFGTLIICLATNVAEE